MHESGVWKLVALMEHHPDFVLRAETAIAGRVLVNVCLNSFQLPLIHGYLKSEHVMLAILALTVDLSQVECQRRFDQ